MEDKLTSVSTQELWARLFQASSVDNYLIENRDACNPPAFSSYITELCKVRDKKPEQVIRRGDIENSFGHRLFSGARNPSRDSALQLAFGFGLDTDETQQLLKVAHAAPLHPKVKRDAVIAYCLHHHKPLVETQQILADNDLPLLGGAKYGE